VGTKHQRGQAVNIPLQSGKRVRLGNLKRKVEKKSEIRGKMKQIPITSGKKESPGNGGNAGFQHSLNLQKGKRTQRHHASKKKNLPGGKSDVLI